MSPEECFVRSRVADERGAVDIAKQIDLNGEIKDMSQSLEIDLALPSRSSHGEVEFCCKRYSGGVNPVATVRFDVPASGQQNPRWAMMKSIMQESSGFKGKSPEDYLKESLLLNRKLDNKVEFEIAMHQLLFLPASTLHIGRAEGVDLAFLDESTTKQAILIGCTTGLLEQIEVAKLGVQRDQLRNELTGYEVIRAAICVPHEIDQLTVGGVSECRQKQIGHFD